MSLGGPNPDLLVCPLLRRCCGTSGRQRCPEQTASIFELLTRLQGSHARGKHPVHFIQSFRQPFMLFWPIRLVGRVHIVEIAGYLNRPEFAGGSNS